MKKRIDPLTILKPLVLVLSISGLAVGAAVGADQLAARYLFVQQPDTLAVRPVVSHSVDAQETVTVSVVEE